MIRGIALAAALCAFGCGSEKSARDEAGALMERIARLDVHAAFEARAAELDALERVSVSTPDLQTLKADCLAAHRGLLSAERAQAAVRERVGGNPSADEIPQLSTVMRSAQHTLAEAHAALGRCEAHTRQATVRYR